MAEEKKLTAYFSARVNVNCPGCDEYLDLLDERDVGSLNEDNGVWQAIFADGRLPIDAWKNIGLEVTCRHCKTEFIWDKLEH